MFFVFVNYFKKLYHTSFKLNTVNFSKVLSPGHPLNPLRGLQCPPDLQMYLTKLILENQKICDSPCKKPLGVRFDSKLTFDTHITDRTDLKLNALAKIPPYMDLHKNRLLLSAFFMSQFNHCQLVWMCHNRTKNIKINRLHERCLCLIYNEKSSFEELLEIFCS